MVASSKKLGVRVNVPYAPPVLPTLQSAGDIAIVSILDARESIQIS